MVEHSTRDHAQWSASATERNWNCAGALALTDNLPEKTNEAADWGTACHQISEKCLREGKQPSDFIGTTEKGKEHSFEVDDEMAETAEMYVNYVRQQAIAAAPAHTNPASLIHVEQRFSLENLKPPFQAGGTADCVIHFPAENKLEVIDLKGGRGHVVEAIGNPQLRTYALGAMLANPGIKVETVTVTIVQPRAPHKSGRIRSDTFHVIDLMEWTTELLLKMHRSAEAVIDKAQLPSAVWESTYLAAGEHCKFCKAAGFCPALERRAMDAVGVWFDDLDQPRISNAPSELSPEHLAQVLDVADMVGEWINAVRAFANAQAEMGIEIPNYVLVEKQGREKWNGDEAEATAIRIARDAGLPDEKILNEPKTRTPKQVRDALAKAKATIALEHIKALSSTPSTGTNLVRADKTTRAPAKPSALKHFDMMD